MLPCYLELIIGPMFSGKTSRLLELYRQYNQCNLNIVVINHSIDNRYNHSSILTNHDKISIPCISVSNISSIWNNESSPYFKQLREADIILINEGQFFEDIYDSVKDMINYNKYIYISGLDGDFKREKFGKILDLIPLCDKVTKLTSICGFCKNGTKGLFSLRKTAEQNQTLVGVDEYIPVCRQCYNSYNHVV